MAASIEAQLYDYETRRMMTQWLYEIHETNPYEGFPDGAYEADLQGWGFESAIFEHLIDIYRPQLLIEIGSWKGASANKMAKLLKQYEIPNPQLICIDTWLGSVEHWLDRADPNHFQSLNLKWGRPNIYHQFIANVLLMDNADVIIPFPASSSTALKFLAAKNLLADAVYIDAGHEYEDVIADMRGSWKLVKPGGVLFGDDYNPGWIGVVRAVHDFADEHSVGIDTSFGLKWLIEKPGGVAARSSAGGSQVRISRSTIAGR
jgi:hypothetical protein